MPSKLLWGEGLFLRPQHFQQQDRYHEACLQQRAHALHPYAWGVQHLVVDQQALSNDVLRIDQLAVIFPDGEMVRAPHSDALPRQVRLADLPPSLQSVTFHAALPALNAHGENCAERDMERGDARYVRRQADTQDLFTQAAHASIDYLQKSVRLIDDAELLAACDSFALLRLRRVAGGGFEADPDFLPPSVSIEGAPGLQNRLARLLEKLLAKTNALYRNLREPSRNTLDLRSTDMASFWLLHTASSGYAALSHYLQHPELHPERLFHDMLGLAGALMAYSRSYTLEDLPVYAHRDPGPAFARLDSILRALLDTVVSSRYFSIPLSNERPSYHVGALDAGKIDGQSMLYLAVAADMPALQLIEVVPRRFKLGAPHDVEQCVLSALPGVKLLHAPQVPAALPVRPDTHYFALDSKSALYQNMLKAQAISIFVPTGLDDLRLDLVGVAP